MIQPEENQRISKLDSHEQQPNIFFGVFSKEKEIKILDFEKKNYKSNAQLKYRTTRTNRYVPTCFSMFSFLFQNNKKI